MDWQFAVSESVNKQTKQRSPNVSCFEKEVFERDNFMICRTLRTQYPSEAREFKLREREPSAPAVSKELSERERSLSRLPALLARALRSGRTGGTSSSSGAASTAGASTAASVGSWTFASGTGFGLKSFLLANNLLSNFFNTGVIKFNDPKDEPLKYTPPYPELVPPYIPRLDDGRPRPAL